jgi:hypothetical protein
VGCRHSRPPVVGNRCLRVTGQERGKVDLLEEEPPTIRRRAWRRSILLVPPILAPNLLPPSRDEAGLLDLLSYWLHELGAKCAPISAASATSSASEAGSVVRLSGMSCRSNFSTVGSTTAPCASSQSGGGSDTSSQA